MPIEAKPLRHWIENFYGYGSWQSRIWFIAYEEGGGDLPEEVADKLNYFYNLPPANPHALCDIREMYRHWEFQAEGPSSDIFANYYEYRFGRHAVLHGFWKDLIAFAHGYKNKKLPDLLTYQKNSFTKNAEAFIQLYPLPSPHNHAWYYSWLDLPDFRFLKRRKDYEDTVFPHRMNRILQNLSSCKPEVVVMYGMNNINILKQSVLDFFPAAKFKMVKAVKQQIPQHHRADLQGTTLVITTQVPGLRHNRIESGFDWEKFGSISR